MDGNDRGRPPSARHTSEQQPTYSAQPYAPISYQSEYAQEPQNRSQPFPAYGSTVVYNIPSSTGQTYGPMTAYPPRQNATIEALSSQFSGAPQYYVPADSPAPVGSALPANHQHPATSQFSSPTYSQYSPATSRLPHPYSATLSEPGQQNPPTTEGESADSNQDAGVQEMYNRYQTALKQTFQNMRDGRLAEAGSSLLTISDWLLSHAEELGLVRDEQDLYTYRTRLWNEFNTCWLSVLGKEKDMLRRFISNGQPPSPPQTLLREEFLERMGRELVRLCDNIERHGLVDYQMGVWEEEIIEAIQECLALYEELPPVEAQPVSRGQSGNPT